MDDPVISTIVTIVVLVSAIAIVVARVRIARIQDFDRSPRQQAFLSAVTAAVVGVAGLVLLLIAITLVAALLSAPWGDIATRLTERGGWLFLLAAFVLLVVVMTLTPSWFRPAHLRALRDDEEHLDSAGRRSGPRLFDNTGQRLPDGTDLDPRG
jgi:choline-glycine betaine transporter